MSVNSYQIGGTHYKTSYEHWDLVSVVGLTYLEGCTTKYVTRSRSKGGLEDLKKALHYLNKIQDTVAEREWATGYVFRAQEVEAFAQANALSAAEKDYILALCTWRYTSDLENARAILFTMMDGIDSGPVPLTEENHHAKRAVECSKVPKCPKEEEENCSDPHCAVTISRVGW